MQIRTEQFQALGRAREERFILEMTAHVRARFPAAAAALEGEALRSKVRELLDRARGYGLSTARDCARFLNVAATFDWQLDRPDLAWIDAYLRDPEVPSPSDRMQRVASRSLRQLRTEEKNRRVRGAFRR
jgi:hypothetical protein